MAGGVAVAVPAPPAAPLAVAVNEGVTLGASVGDGVPPMPAVALAVAVSVGVENPVAVAVAVGVVGGVGSSAPGELLVGELVGPAEVAVIEGVGVASPVGVGVGVAAAAGGSVGVDVGATNCGPESDRLPKPKTAAGASTLTASESESGNPLLESMELESKQLPSVSATTNTSIPPPSQKPPEQTRVPTSIGKGSPSR